MGEALVAAFATHGYRVIFQYYRNVASAKRLKTRVGAAPLPIHFDTDFKLGKFEFDVLINNAAINDTDVLSHRVTINEWDRCLRVNLTVPFLLVGKCLPFMIRRRFGRIINISSIYGLHAVRNRLPYTATKHGLSGLTKTIAKEYADVGITCNEICPGPIKSKMMKRIAAAAAPKEGQTPAEWLQEVEDEIPAKRMAQTTEVADLALFLASANSAHINGTSIPLDGGMIA